MPSKTPIGLYAGELEALAVGDFVPVANGGTGAINASGARANLGVAEIGNIPQIPFSVNVVLALSDIGKHLFHPTSDIAARTVTIPANAVLDFPIGTVITIVNNNNAGIVSIAIITDTMRLAGPGTTGTRSLAANGMCTIMKISPTEWIISGVGLT